MTDYEIESIYTLDSIIRKNPAKYSLISSERVPKLNFHSIFRRSAPIKGNRGDSDIIEILKKLTNIVCAGGFPFCMLRSIVTNCDIDLFFIETDINVLNKRLCDAIKLIIAYYQEQPDRPNAMYTISKSENAITLTLCERSYQFILRGYPSINHVLAGFDIPAAAIAFDGTNCYFSHVSYICFQNTISLLDTTRASPSYNYRLTKYHNRGVSVILPGLRKTPMTKLVESTYGRYQQIGQLRTLHSTRGLEIIDTYHTSDYNSTKGHMIHNCIRVLNDKIVTVSGKGDLRDLTIDEVFKFLNTAHDLKFDKYADSVKKVTISVLSGQIHINKIRIILSLSEVRVLKSLLGKKQRCLHCDCKCDQYCICDPYCINTYLNADNIYLDNSKGAAWLSQIVDEKLTSLREKVIDQEKRLTGISWLTKNPGRQWTSSFHPDDISPRDWYGHHYTPFIIGFPDHENMLRLCLTRLGVPKDVRSIIVEMYLFDLCSLALFWPVPK